MGRSNRDAFNAIVVWVLGRANESTPLPVDLDFAQIPDHLRELIAEVAADDREQGRIWSESIRFLQREGYLLLKPSNRDPRRFEFVYLTEKAMAVLDSVPPALGGRTLGSRVSDVAKEAGKAGAQATVAETVGVIIGTAARTFGGSG